VAPRAALVGLLSLGLASSFADSGRPEPAEQSRCFYSERAGYMRCLPDFIYFGKGHAGSSTLASWLPKHPQIQWNVKCDRQSLSHETRYFTKLAGRSKTASGIVADRDTFANFFTNRSVSSPTPPSGAPGFVQGCKEPAGLGIPEEHFKATIRAMRAMMPWLKLVVFIREPGELELSKTTAAKLRSWSQPGIVGERECALHRGTRDACEPTSDLSRKVQYLLDTFPEGHVFVGQTEQLALRPLNVLANMETFLGISHANWTKLIGPRPANAHVVSERLLTVELRCAADARHACDVRAFDTLVAERSRELALGNGAWANSSRTGYAPEAREALRYFGGRDALRHSPPLPNAREACKKVVDELCSARPTRPAHPDSPRAVAARVRLRLRLRMRNRTPRRGGPRSARRPG
jgi:hypothetical protein